MPLGQTHDSTCGGGAVVSQPEVPLPQDARRDPDLRGDGDVRVEVAVERDEEIDERILYPAQRRLGHGAAQVVERDLMEPRRARDRGGGTVAIRDAELLLTLLHAAHASSTATRCHFRGRGVARRPRVE